MITPNYVMATGKCTCGLSGDYNYHTRVFVNENPATKIHGVLYFEEGLYYGPNIGTSPEGLWVAEDTDMDFCLVHGKSHDNSGIFLIPYNGVINGKVVTNGYFTGQTVAAQNATQNITQDITQDITPNTTPDIQVQAQYYEEENIKFPIRNQTYMLDKEKLKEFEINDSWITEL